MTLFLTNAALDDLAAYFGTRVDALSLHSADPGGTGANEITTDGRQVPAWDTNGSGQLTLSAAEDFTGAPAGTTVTHVGLWLAGAYRGSVSRTRGDAATNSAGEYSVSNITVTETVS
jgi:hypothetical protein